MSDDTRPYKAGFEAMHERIHGGAAMDTLENAQKRAEYWKAEHLAANAEIERLRSALGWLVIRRTDGTVRLNQDPVALEMAGKLMKVPNAPLNRRGD